MNEVPILFIPPRHNIIIKKEEEEEEEEEEEKKKEDDGRKKKKKKKNCENGGDADSSIPITGTILHNRILILTQH